MVKLGRSDDMARADDKSVSHLPERIGVATVKKKIVYGMEIETLFYFRVRGK
jgi:hypothetical protein